MNKDIIYNRKNKDFDAYLNSEYIGSFSTMQEAQTELDRIAYEQLKRAI
jgi:hypothetical protein